MKDYMTIDDMTEYFDISKSTLSEWRKAGLKAIKIGGKVLFKKEKINDFLNQDQYELCEYQR